MAEQRSEITVSFMGGSLLVPDLPPSVTVPIPSPLTVSDLFRLVEEATGIPDLIAKVSRYYIVLIDGTTIQHLNGWDTIVQPGSNVSILAPMGGG